MANEYFDIKQDAVKLDDIANRELVLNTNSKSIKLMYFTHVENALWAADRAIKSLSFPAYEISLEVNRYAFNLRPGQCFLWSSAKYGITDMVMRIMAVSEAPLDSEKIILTCISDPNYITTPIQLVNTGGWIGVPPDASELSVDPLDYFKVVESPYVLVGDVMAVTPLAARVTGKEVRYMLYLSLDGGSSYTSLIAIDKFQPHGLLTATYTANRARIDDKWGFTFDASYDPDWNNVESISRSLLYASYNLALLGNEIISFQTITPDPVVSGRYHIDGVWGGKFDTDIEEHAAGEEFWFFGSAAPYLSNSNVLVGSNPYFKGVPITSKALGSVAEALSSNIAAVYGRSRAPYPVANLKANGELAELYPIYARGDDIVLTWDARIRGQGAGTQIPVETDSPGSYEGYFRVDVLHGASVVRSTTGLTSETWTYTEAMNLADGGHVDLTFKVYNYIPEVGVTFTSIVRTITVTLVHGYGESVSSSSRSSSSSSSSSLSSSSSSSSNSSSSSRSSSSSSSSRSSSSSSSSRSSSSSSSSLSSSSSSA